MTHSHSHHGSAPPRPPADARDGERRLRTAMLLTGVFMVVEAAGGVLAGSLALLADAGHMLADTGALALAWTAARIARRPADRRRSYGYHRFPVIAAFANGVTLLAVVAWILVEAVHRLSEPVPVLGGPMLAVAVAGLAVNVAAFRVLHGGDRENLNLRAALLHVAGDLLGSAGAILAALVILITGWTPIDPLLSVLVAVLILRGALAVVRRSGHVLMQGTPEDLDPARIRRTLAGAIEGVEDVHHVHVWSLTPDRRVATLHARIDEAADPQVVLEAVLACLRERFRIEHATVQIERGDCLHPGPDARDAMTGAGVAGPPGRAG